MQRQIAYYKCPVCGAKNAFNEADAQEVGGRLICAPQLPSRDPGACLCGFVFKLDEPEHLHRVSEEKKS